MELLSKRLKLKPPNLLYTLPVREEKRGRGESDREIFCHGLILSLHIKSHARQHSHQFTKIVAEADPETLRLGPASR